MSTVTITIDSSDFPFIIESIRARSNALLGSVTAQVTSQLVPKPEETVTITASEMPKIAPKKGKDASAPWGYKKDGTPRGKPGRKA